MAPPPWFRQRDHAGIRDRAGYAHTMRRLLKVLLVLGAIVAAIWVWGYFNARADPIVRQTRINLRDWPRGSAPIGVALISDVQIGNMAMDGARLSRIVAQINAL